MKFLNYKETILKHVKTDGDTKYRKHYCLSFIFSLESITDCYISYAIPYTYSWMKSLVSDLCIENPIKVSWMTLTKSISGVEIPLLKISNGMASNMIYVPKTWD